MKEIRLEVFSKDKYIIEEKELTRVLSYIKRLENRIDKSIKYLEKNTYDKNGECGYTYDWNVRELYDILKGSDSNE